MANDSLEELAPDSPGGSLNVSGQSRQPEVLGACGGKDDQSARSVGGLTDEGLSGVCAFCTCKISVKAIDCRDCAQSFHPVPECVGLKQTVIEGLLAENRHAISYHCIKCRSESHSARSSAGAPTDVTDQSALSQLIVAVGALCSQVRVLTQNWSNLQNNSNNGEVTASDPSGPLPNQRIDSQPTPVTETVRAEVRELNEQEKRKQNLILKGFGNDIHAVETKFKNVVHRLIGSDCELHDVTRIAGQNGMYRVKLLNVELRRDILQNAKKLNGIDGFQSIYIQRDLTYKQRQELFRRKDQLRASSGGEQHRQLRSGRSVAGEGSRSHGTDARRAASANVDEGTGRGRGTTFRGGHGANAVRGGGRGRGVRGRGVAQSCSGPSRCSDDSSVVSNVRSSFADVARGRGSNGGGAEAVDLPNRGSRNFATC